MVNDRHDVAKGESVAGRHGRGGVKHGRFAFPSTLLLQLHVGHVIQNPCPFSLVDFTPGCKNVLEILKLSALLEPEIVLDTHNAVIARILICAIQNKANQTTGGLLEYTLT